MRQQALGDQDGATGQAQADPASVKPKLAPFPAPETDEERATQDIDVNQALYRIEKRCPTYCRPEPDISGNGGQEENAYLNQR